MQGCNLKDKPGNSKQIQGQHGVKSDFGHAFFIPTLPGVINYSLIKITTMVRRLSPIMQIARELKILEIRFTWVNDTIHTTLLHITYLDDLDVVVIGSLVHRKYVCSYDWLDADKAIDCMYDFQLELKQLMQHGNYNGCEQSVN
jgi:hypothetical protein